MLQRRLRLTRIVGASAIVTAALWAVAAPLPRWDQAMLGAPAAPDVAGMKHDPPARPLIDSSVFEVALWNPTPPPPPPARIAEEAPRALPPTLKLVAVLEQDGNLRAALSDPALDRLLIVAQGDRVQRFMVSSVTRQIVELRDGPETFELRLREGQDRLQARRSPR